MKTLNEDCGCSTSEKAVRRKQRGRGGSRRGLGTHTPPKSLPGCSEKGKILEPQSFQMQEEQDNSIIDIKT